MKNVGNNSRGRSQEVPKIFMAPMYRAHCAVIFAIAQLSCYLKEEARSRERGTCPIATHYSLLSFVI